jgi:hypothetical protein
MDNFIETNGSEVGAHHDWAPPHGALRLRNSPRLDRVIGQAIFARCITQESRCTSSFI